MVICFTSSPLITQKITRNFSQTNKRIEKNPIPNQKLKDDNKCRIAFYCHNQIELDYQQYSITIAQNLGFSPRDIDILFITDTIKSNSLQNCHHCIDCLTLPSLNKDSDGAYSPKQWHISLKEMINLRSQIIFSTIKNFQPNVLIVDHIPRGVKGELNTTLKYLAQKKDTHCILGLKDTPTNYPNSTNKKDEKAINRYYHRIWLY